MGIKEDNQKRKREISVGFIEPESYDLEEDIIYVTLVPYGGSTRAEAVSREEFWFTMQETILTGKEANNYTGHSREGTPMHTNHLDFIEMLERKNNGKIKNYRMETDGLKLVKILQEIHHSTGIVKTF